MPRSRTWGALKAMITALSLLLMVGTLEPSAAVADPQRDSHVVGHQGRWLVDGQGRVVTLHGFNMVAKVAPYTVQSVGFGDDDAKFLADNGFNAVRLGMMWKKVEPKPGVYDEAYLDQIADTVAVLAERGIYTLIDFHQDYYSEQFGGQGFPDWAVDTWIGGLLPAPTDGGQFSLAQFTAWDHFWANVKAPDGVPLWDRFALFWRHVAARFAGNPAVIGYDLMNEPIPGSQFALCANPVVCPFDNTLGRFYAYVIPRIREIDPDHLIWYEPNILAGAGMALNIDHGGDPNAVLSFHDYCAGTALSGGNLPAEIRDALCPPDENLDLDNAEAQAAHNNDGLVMTEFGSVPHLPEVQRLATAADERRVGWMEWTYNNTGTTNFPGEYSLVKDPKQPPTGDNVNTGILTTLARPYPQAIAGTPGAWAFDPESHVFTVTYTTERIDGAGSFGPGARTNVAVPRIQYPAGYQVEVSGARVVSSPGAPVLLLEAEPGATAVELEVRPRQG